MKNNNSIHFPSRKQQLKILQKLRKIGNSLFHCQTIEDIFEQVYQEIEEKIHPQVISLFLFSKNGCIQRRAFFGIDRDGKKIDQKWLIDEHYQPGESFSGKAVPINTNTNSSNPYGETYTSNELDQGVDKLSYGNEYRQKLGFLKCGISVPLNGTNRTFGTLEVINKIDPSTGNPDKKLLFSEEEVYWLTILGAHVANAISRLRKKNEDEIVYDITTRVANPYNEKYSIESVYKSIAEKLIHKEFMPYKVCIFRLKYEGDYLSVIDKACTKDVKWLERSDEPRTSGQGIVGEVFKSKKPIIIQNIETNKQKFFNKQWLEINQLKSCICYPLIMQGEVVGTVTLFTGYHHNFSDSDKAFLENISFQLGAFKVINELWKEEWIKKKETEFSNREKHLQEKETELINREKRLQEKEKDEPKKYKQVLESIRNQKYEFRTIKGICEETGIDESEVRHILEKSPEVRKSIARDKNGNELFTDRKTMKFREVVSIIQQYLSKPYL
jgi:GAF domain-containing protein